MKDVALVKAVINRLYPQIYYNGCEIFQGKFCISELLSTTDQELWKNKSIYSLCYSPRQNISECRKRSTENTGTHPWQEVPVLQHGRRVQLMNNTGSREHAPSLGVFTDVCRHKLLRSAV
jgi:hypothetical protein